MWLGEFMKIIKVLWKIESKIFQSIWSPKIHTDILLKKKHVMLVSVPSLDNITQVTFYADLRKFLISEENFEIFVPMQMHYQIIGVN